MIVPKAPQIRRMVQYVGTPLIALVVWDVLVVLAYNLLHWQWIGLKEVPLAFYGSAIGIIVGFRNNSAYARWWEARGLWGRIVNDSRNFARLVCTTMRPADGAEDEAALALVQGRLVHYQIAFVHALRQQLRGLDAVAVTEPFVSAADLEELKREKNVPLALQRRMSLLVRDARSRGWIDNIEWQAIDRCLFELANSQGGTERIKNTPMPKQYDFFPMLFVQIYCVLLPIGMVKDLEWLTPLGSTLVGFMFLALDKIGRDLEDPFNNTIFDVPLTAISKTIEINLRQLLGETSIPAAETPVAGVLW